MKNSNLNSVLDQTYRKKIRKCCDVISGLLLLQINMLSIMKHNRTENVDFEHVFLCPSTHVYLPLVGTDQYIFSIYDINYYVLLASGT